MMDIENAPRMAFTLSADGSLAIKNLDPLDLTVGHTVVFRLVRETPVPEGGEVHQAATRPA